MGVVVRRYVDFLILLIPTPLVSVLLYSSIPTFCSFLKCFSFFIIILMARTEIACSVVSQGLQAVLGGLWTVAEK